MAPPDDDIPDLFPGPGAQSRPKAPLPAASAQRAPVPAPPRPQAAPENRASKPPAIFVDSEPRPSRPIPGPDSGLELETLDEPPHQPGQATVIAGTADELEFDLTSQPPPDFEEARLRQPKFDERKDRAKLLDLELELAGAQKKTPSVARRSSRPSSVRPPRVDASLHEVPSLPSLDVPSLKPQVAPAPAQKASPSRNPPAAAQQSGFAVAGLGAFPGMGNEVDLGDGLDDLDFGGAASAQLNVGLPEREEGDNVPWPLGRTPEGDEISVSAGEAEEMSGFGPAPQGFLQAPLYALRVYRALGTLREKNGEAEKHLCEMEDARDEMLATLAGEKRSELQKNDRFRGLYAELDTHEQKINLRKRDLEMADVEGAQALRDVQAEIDTLNVERLGKAKARDEKRVVMEEADRKLKRQQAALRRVQIEWRNIEARAAKTPGSEMPPELDAQLDVLETQQIRAKDDLDYALKQFKDVKKQLGDAENAVRIALAQVQRAEGKKEGLLMAYEGDIGECSRALDKALFEKQQALTNAGRAIVDLRGEIPVKAQVRANLLAADEQVAAAARHLKTARMALGSMDLDVYGTGRAVWIGGILVLLLLLAYSTV